MTTASREEIEGHLRSGNEADWRAATLAAYEAGNPYGALLPFMTPDAIVDAQALRRATAIVGAIREISRGPYAGTNLVPPLLSRTLPVRSDAAAWAVHGDALIDAVVGFLARKGYELVLADVVRHDVEGATLEALFRRVASLGAKAVEAADVQVRKVAGMKGTGADVKRRAVVARRALGVEVRAARPPIPLKEGPGTGGGPLLALPEEVLAAWNGTAAPSRRIEARSRFGDPKAPATDYDRACDVSESRVGLLDVGALKGLVLGHTGCRWAVLRDRSCLLVLEGMADDVADAPFATGWKKIEGTLEVPGGKLVVFDATAARAKTREKKAVKLVPGTYAVDELYREAPFLWVVRLTPREA